MPAPKRRRREPTNFWQQLQPGRTMIVLPFAIRSRRGQLHRSCGTTRSIQRRGSSRYSPITSRESLALCLVLAGLSCGLLRGGLIRLRNCWPSATPPLNPAFLLAGLGLFGCDLLTHDDARFQPACPSTALHPEHFHWRQAAASLACRYGPVRGPSPHSTLSRFPGP